MAQKYGLWGAIAGTFLLAILGVRSAANWLSNSSPSTPDSAISSVDGDNGRPIGAGRLGEDDTQTNARFGDQSEPREGETVTFSPLEEAGTYIQRQKRVEFDSVVAATNVEAIPVAVAEPVSAQPNTQTAETAEPETSAQTEARPAETRPVPALW